MSVQENARIARAHYELFNQRDFERSALLIAPNASWMSIPSGLCLKGLSQYQRWISTWTTAFPDAHLEPTNLIATHEWVIAEVIGRGTHDGALGDIPPTGRKVQMGFCEILRIRHGRIYTARLYFDLATLMHQLGCQIARQ